jgi:microcystin-dependent protein
MLPTGISLSYFGSTAPDGWLLLNGETIGTPSSGATSKASFDTWALYKLLWENTVVSVAGGKGWDAEQDFAANKALYLPDARGRVIAGSDPSGVILPGTSPGDTLGFAAHQLEFGEIPNHLHGFQGGGAFDNNGDGSQASAVQGTDTAGYVDNGGGCQAHNNVQPTLVANWIIKL